jgi:hypothetical protein
MSVIQLLKEERQEDCDFMGSLGKIRETLSKIKINK